MLADSRQHTLSDLVSGAGAAWLFPLFISVRSGKERLCNVETKVVGEGGSHACEYCRNFA